MTANDYFKTGLFAFLVALCSHMLLDWWDRNHRIR